ncbi:AGAP004668-PA [Anopheles gambiae str. PEST]|uniref:AGAP004668-PA n=2 Tax=gambiae species complex TaxID=44542 RepID=Q7Q2C9_ANOGA|nr:coiled-coil domain-containing protein 12 [Anopheles coluzzii]EAA13568.4 AGAP004668-PA [Anopheles gambiae str. PEST]
MANVIGRLQEEALKRKNRLKELRHKRNHEELQQIMVNEVSANIPKPVFRNYKHVTEYEIQESSAIANQAGIVEKQIDVQLEMMTTPIVIDEIDIVNLAPRKPDWDLKRDVSKKLEKLDRKTQKAIAEIIRDRLIAGQEQDILKAVNVATSAPSVALNENHTDN